MKGECQIYRDAVKQSLEFLPRCILTVFPLCFFDVLLLVKKIFWGEIAPADLPTIQLIWRRLRWLLAPGLARTWTRPGPSEHGNNRKNIQWPKQAQ